MNKITFNGTLSDYNRIRNIQGLQFNKAYYSFIPKRVVIETNAGTIELKVGDTIEVKSDGTIFVTSPSKILKSMQNRFIKVKWLTYSIEEMQEAEKLSEITNQQVMPQTYECVGYISLSHIVAFRENEIEDSESRGKIQVVSVYLTSGDEVMLGHTSEEFHKMIYDIKNHI